MEAELVFADTWCQIMEKIVQNDYEDSNSLHNLCMCPGKRVYLNPVIAHLSISGKSGAVSVSWSVPGPSLLLCFVSSVATISCNVVIIFFGIYSSIDFAEVVF